MMRPIAQPLTPTLSPQAGRGSSGQRPLYRESSRRPRPAYSAAFFMSG